MIPERSSLPSHDVIKRSAQPRRRPPRAAVPGRTPTSRVATRPAESARILVVEDDFLVSMEMEAVLTEAGFDVVGVASSFEEAIEMATSQRPALVVMDIRLSGKRDGIDIAVELFREHGLRCIFASAHQDPDAQRRASPAEPLGWLPKPYTMASLVELVQRALRDLASKSQ